MDEKERATLGLHLEAVQAVRKVLWDRWDPIGVNDCPEASTEYDGYAGGVLTRLVRGSSDRELADHLGEIERVSMGLSGSSVDRRLMVAQEIRKAVAGLGAAGP